MIIGRHHRLLAWILCWLALAFVGGMASMPAQSERVLRIGYLADGSTPPASAVRGLVDALNEELRTDAELPSLFKESGLTGVVASAAPSVRELTENLAISRYDIVFAPVGAMRDWKTAEMRVVFQQRRPGDTWDPRGARGVRQTSVLFRDASRKIEPAKGRWAFIGGDSAAGFIYPRLRLLYDHDVADLTDIIFRPNAEEVFLIVMNGLADFGAMDQSSFDQLLAEHRRRVAETPEPPFKAPALELLVMDRIELPAPPVLFSSELAGRSSTIGAALRRLVRGYFEGNKDAFEITLVDANDKLFETVKEDLDRFYSLLDSAPDASPSENDNKHVERDDTLTPSELGESTP